MQEGDNKTATEAGQRGDERKEQGRHLMLNTGKKITEETFTSKTYRLAQVKRKYYWDRTEVLYFQVKIEKQIKVGKYLWLRC